MEPTTLLWTTYIDFIQSGNYETCAIIVFVLIMLWGVYESATSTSKISGKKNVMSDETTKDLFSVGIVAVLGGLGWPLVVPLFTIAFIVLGVYKLMIRFKREKK